MSDQSIRAGEPQVLARMPSSEVGEIPSVRLPWWELVCLWGLVGVSPVITATAYAFRTGRDLTIPYLAAEAVVCAIGVGLIAVGILQRDRLRGGVGGIAAVSVLCLSSFAGTGMLWSGFKEIEFRLVVVDANTGAPIPDALVSFSADGMTAVGQTDRDGKTIVRWGCFTSGASSLVCETGGAEFRAATKASAAGYADFQEQLRNLARRGMDLHGPPPPVVRIRLSPDK